MGMSDDHEHGHVANARDASPVIEVDIGNAYDASEYAGLEEHLRGLPGATSVHLDRTRGVAHLGYDPAVTTPEALEGRLSQCGYRCDCYGRPGSVAQAGHPRVGVEEHVGHVPAVKPEEHAAMGHGEHTGHGAAMVSDLFRRFVISTLLALPLIIFSPIGGTLGLPGRPPLG